MFNSRLIVETPYDQSGIVTGYSDRAKYQSDQYLHLDLLGGGTNLISVIKAYSDSYRASNIKTLLDCRDYFVAKALIVTLRSSLYTDATRQQLTSHAQKAVSRVTTKAVYPEVLKNKDQVFADSFGSLAYYFLFVKPEGYPTEYITKLLTYVWGLLGISYTALPKDRITKLYKLLGRTKDIDKLAQDAIKQVLSAQPVSDLYPALIQARRNFITEADVTNFSLRILTGKYSTELFPLFAAALPEEQYKKLAVYKSNIISVLRPVGFNLLLNSFIVEGYLKAAQYISGLPDNLTSRSLDDFLANEEFKTTHGAVVAGHLATSYDALDFLQSYSLYADFGSEPEDLLAFIYSWTPPAVYAKDPTRLYTLFDTIDIDKNTRKLFTNNLLSELAQLAPVGAESLSLESSATANKISLTAINFSSNSTPIIAFVESSATKAPSSISSVSNTTTSFTNNAVIVDVDSNRSIGAVALTGSGLQDGVVLSLADLNRFRSEETPDVSVSNVQVIEGTVIPDGISEEVADLTTQQANRYYLFNYLTATSRPRGSVESRYESQGIKPEVLNTAQIESTFGYRQEGYIDEYAGRMAGLTEQQKEVHAQSELQVLKEWATAIKQITEGIGS
jgi:hypothetical protein